MTNFAFPNYNEIDGMTKAPDNAVWFTLTDNQSGVSKIGRITTS